MSTCLNCGATVVQAPPYKGGWVDVYLRTVHAIITGQVCSHVCLLALVNHATVTASCNSNPLVAPSAVPKTPPKAEPS